MSVGITVKPDIGMARYLEFRYSKDRAEAVKLMETVAGTPKDDEPVMFTIGPWQVYVVPTGN